MFWFEIDGVWQKIGPVSSWSLVGVDHPRVAVTGVKVTDSNGVTIGPSYSGGGATILLSSYELLQSSSSTAYGIPTTAFDRIPNNNVLTKTGGIYGSLGSSGYVLSSLTDASNNVVATIDTASQPYATVTLSGSTYFGRINYTPAPSAPDGYVGAFLIETSVSGTTWTKYKVVNFSDCLGLFYTLNPVGTDTIGTTVTNQSELTTHANKILLGVDVGPKTLTAGMYVIHATEGKAIKYDGTVWKYDGYQDRGSRNTPNTLFEIPVDITTQRLRITALTACNVPLTGSSPSIYMGDFSFYASSSNPDNTEHPAELVAMSSVYNTTVDLLGKNAPFSQQAYSSSWNLYAKTYNAQGVPSYGSVDSISLGIYDWAQAGSYWISVFSTLAVSRPSVLQNSGFVGTAVVSAETGHSLRLFSQSAAPTGGATYLETAVAGDFSSQETGFSFLAKRTLDGGNLTDLYSTPNDVRVFPVFPPEIATCVTRYDSTIAASGNTSVSCSIVTNVLTTGLTFSRATQEWIGGTWSPASPTFTSTTATAVSFNSPNTTLGERTYRYILKNTVGGVEKIIYSDPIVVGINPRTLRFNQDYPDVVYVFIPKSASIPLWFDALNQAVTANFTSLQYEWKRNGTSISSGSSASTVNTSNLTVGQYSFTRTVSDTQSLCTPITSSVLVVVAETDATFSNGFVPF